MVLNIELLNSVAIFFSLHVSLNSLESEQRIFVLPAVCFAEVLQAAPCSEAPSTEILL